MKKQNPSSFVDFTRGSELWTHQFKMFLTGISNVLILGVFLTVCVVGGFLYLKVEPVELYALKTEAEIIYKSSLNVPNKEIQLHLNGRPQNVSIEQAEKIIEPHLKSFWWDLKRALFLGIFLSIIIIGSLVWYWYNYGKNVMEDEQLRGAKIVPKDKLKQMLKDREEEGEYTIADVPIRKGTEGNNICFVGAPQSGKSQAIRAFLEQVRGRNKKAVIYDPSGEFTQEFYREGKDIILNPFDDRCPNWNVWNEIEEDQHFDAIASGLIPIPASGDTFFPEAARRSLTDIIRVLSANKNNQTNKNLFETVAVTTLTELHELLAGTAGATYFDPKTEKTGVNIKMTILNYLDPFRFLRDDGKPFSIRKWVREEDDSWIFITTKEEQKNAIKPIISLWISTVIKATMSLPAIHKERMWLSIDEMPTLQKMDDLILSLTNTRKYGLCHLIGLQDFSQLDQTYGKDNAATMVSTLQTKLILRVTDSSSADRLAKIIGQMEVDEKNMSRSMGVTDGRDGDSFYSQRKERNVVLPSEIMSLPNLEGYLKIVGDYPVAKVKTQYVPHTANAIPFIKRSTGIALNDYEDMKLDKSELDLEKVDTISNDIKENKSEIIEQNLIVKDSKNNAELDDHKLEKENVSNSDEVLEKKPSEVDSENEDTVENNSPKLNSNSDVKSESLDDGLEDEPQYSGDFFNSIDDVSPRKRGNEK
ncbi:type IV secretion system DNA-binding domain-containing protein [Acinetobacter lwoffii]|uniref:type IV secretion system DNA-binding domain-containing protein n=1 Tax=Acinetobacter lwoffii TaxID=28090 RepID=UPI00259D49F0|nr:type IV secretion system DNA-binding domain-containing protein [Acinetobacter baumannii]